MGTRDHCDPRELARAAKTSILIVDEQPALRALQVSSFERLGCLVHPAVTLEEAIGAARDAKFDVAIISEGILRKNAAGACESLRSAAGHDRLPIVLLSDHEMPEAFGQEGACGLSDFVPRSVSQIDLVQRVANLLQIPPRRFVRTMVALSFPSTRSKVEYLGHSRDISRTGILIETGRRLALQESLPIKFLLPNNNSLVNALTQVIRVVRNPLSGQFEVGFQFVDIDLGSMERIENFLHQEALPF